MSDVCLDVSRQAVRRPEAERIPYGPRRSAILSCSSVNLLPSAVESVSLLTFEVAANDRCAMCGTCSNVCPVKALRTVSETGGLALCFYPSLCTGYRICEVECLEGAIAVLRAFSSAWLDVQNSVVKARDKIEQCRRCNNSIGPSLSLRKLYDTLEKQESRELANSVYLCHECKSGFLTGW